MLTIRNCISSVIHHESLNWSRGCCSALNNYQSGWQLNPSKSEFLRCTTLRRRHLLDSDTFSLGDAEVLPADVISNLESTVTAAWPGRPTWAKWFEVVFTNCVALKPSVNSFRPQLVNSFIVSRVDYCKNIHHVSDLLRDNLHWLRFPQRITYKLCLITYKAIHNRMPDYITDFCISAADNRLRSSSKNLLQVFHEVWRLFLLCRWTHCLGQPPSLFEECAILGDI